MNIFLIPYSAWRHFNMAFFCAIFGLLAWWIVLSWCLLLGMFWAPSMDGLIWLVALSSFVAMASALGEGNLLRWPIRKRVMQMLLAGVLAGGCTFLLFWLWRGFAWIFVSQAAMPNFQDPHLVSLRYQVGGFVSAGVGTAISLLICRRPTEKRYYAHHLLGGAIAGVGAAVIWLFMNLFAVKIWQEIGLHLYWASAGASLGFGFLFGLTAWGIPDSLYAGWLRVLSHHRFAHRVPIDAKKGGAKERFIGHYPNGLDLFLPVEDGVRELHISVFVDDQQRYTLRGLSQEHTRIRRFLEWFRLEYDESRPAPFETKLSSEDRIRMGEHAVVEFLMLPREEQ